MWFQNLLSGLYEQLLTTYYVCSVIFWNLTLCAMLRIEKSCVTQKKITLHSCSHFQHGWDMYDISDISDKWTPGNSAEFPRTRPIVPGTRSIVAGTQPVVVCTRLVVAGTNPEFTWFIDLVSLDWIHRHSANYSRQNKALNNFTSQWPKGHRQLILYSDTIIR
jgi:hypothetical protein